MKQHRITVPKTARYFTLGEAGPGIREVWFVCHGYGQLANYFLRHFAALDDGQTLVVAPEGLHRFYFNGFSGRVTASWMTREDRLDDIADYTRALDLVYDEVMQTAGPDVRINVLGFSQGSATVSRWMAASPKRFDALVLWCGFFPPDMNWENDLPKFKQWKTAIVTATGDEFISPEQEAEQLSLFRKSGIPFTHTRFTGKHAMDTETLISLQRTFREGNAHIM